ncbi:MAG: hypothetical protein ACQETI_02515 [Halobacteriota archaeon]
MIYHFARPLLESLLVDALGLVTRTVWATLVFGVSLVLGGGLSALVSKAPVRAVPELVARTTVGRLLGGTPAEVRRVSGLLGGAAVVGLGVVAATQILDVVVLSRAVAWGLSRLPTVAGGLGVLLVGLVVADLAADRVAGGSPAVSDPLGYGPDPGERVRVRPEVRLRRLAASGTRAVLYAATGVVALDTVGVNVAIFVVVARMLALGAAVAVALALGIAVGFGAKDHVAAALDDLRERRADPPTSTDD